MWSFIGTSLVSNENNTAESYVNVDNCGFFVEIPSSSFVFLCVYFCFSLVCSGLFSGSSS